MASVGGGGGALWQVWAVVEVLLGRCGWRCSAVMTEDLHKQFVNFVTVPDRVCRGTRSQGIKRKETERKRERYRSATYRQQISASIGAWKCNFPPFRQF